jgi:hydroxyacylglutathione hydrolase
MSVTSTLKIVPLRALADNYIWALSPDNGSSLVVVDPGEAEPVLLELERRPARLSAILVTHHHPDHTAGIERLLRENEVPVYGPAHEIRPIPGLTRPLGEGDRIVAEGLETAFEVIAVPGHTAGHIAYYGTHGGGGALFSGDTLFFAGCGRLFEGDAAQMRHSLAKLRELPDDTRVYCGHEYTEKNLSFAAVVEPENADVAEQLALARSLRADDRPTLPSDIALEKRVNPFLRWDQPSVVAAAEAYAGGELSGPDAVLATLRKWKDAF